MKDNLLDYLINEYELFLKSEYNHPVIDFFTWINEAEKCDYWKKEIKEFKKIYKYELINGGNLI